jgi:hypothetical protein
MSVTHFAPVPELVRGDTPPVAAIVYADNAYPDAAFKAGVAWCRQRGLSLAGALQHREFPTGEQRCEVVLEDLTSGHRTALYENRGTGAKGCRLDEAALAEATARIEGGLAEDPYLLVLNKFGKAECGVFGSFRKRHRPKSANHYWRASKQSCCMA